MECSVEFIDYLQTSYFSSIVTDYISKKDSLKNFYGHSVNVEGIKASIEQRKKFHTNRQLLVTQLQKQYVAVTTSDKVTNNINALLSENTFTICTAHQPNIFTGHLYFIYKIVHVIKIADTLKKQRPENNFVPVFYVGSEDADLDELGHIYINSEKHEWKTKQTGAVGRMKIDDELVKIIDKVNGQLSVEPFGKEIIELIKTSYNKGSTIQDATFKLVDSLFKDFGLIVLLPDNAELKNSMLQIFEDDIFNNTPSTIVNKTSDELKQEYKVQAHPREINLFYLKDDLRNRIVKQNDVYRINDTDISFSKEEIKEELKNHPERFSPNVILRGLYQEIILPNIAFVGGGGEIAYWFELKGVFKHYNVPFPVLIIRNSFVVVEQKINELIKKLSFTPKDIFRSETELVNDITRKNTDHKLNLGKEEEEIKNIYNNIKSYAEQIDVTLKPHVEALQARVLKTLDALEKKMLKSEKKRYEAQLRQIQKIKTSLFPNGELQERVDNFMPYYAKWGSDFIKMLYDNALTLEQEFCIIQTG